MPGPIVQSVASLIANPGVVSLILAEPHTFKEMIMKYFYSHSPPSGLLSVTSKSYALRTGKPLHLFLACPVTVST